MVDDMGERLAQFETMLDGFRQVSEMLNGAVADLQRQGWTEEQARELAVATFVNSLRRSM